MTESYTPSKYMLAFLKQNTLCGAGMTYEQIELADEHGLARPHSGNLIVLQGASDGGPTPTTIVKMHDSWGTRYEVIVHTYDPSAEDPDSDVAEEITGYDNPKEAAEAFFGLLMIERERA